MNMPRYFGILFSVQRSGRVTHNQNIRCFAIYFTLAMFQSGSFACSFVAGFLPVFSDNYDCSSTFVVSMATACIVALVLRYRKASILHSFLGGLGCYFACLIGVTAITEALHPTGHFDLGWFLFACIFVLPRAAFSAILGLAVCEIFRIARPHRARG